MFTIISITRRGIILCTPIRTLRIIWGSIVVHRSLTSFIHNSLSTCINSIIIETWLVILVEFTWYKTSVNRNSLIIRTKLHYNRLVISLNNTTSVSFPLASSYQDYLTNQFILETSIHTSNSFTLTILHELLS